MKKIIMIVTAGFLTLSFLKAQNINCQTGVGQLAGVIAWKGKKLSSSSSQGPSNGTMTFKVTCDRTVDGTCFYFDDGQRDTVVKKVCEGVMIPSIPNVTLYDEFHQIIHSGTLHAYWENPIGNSPLWIREYTFHFQ